MKGSIPSPRLFSTGNLPPELSTSGNDKTPVITELYTAELYVPSPCFSTGVANLNGSAVSGNLKLGIFTSAGVLVAATASTAQAGIDTLQRIPWATEFVSNPGVSTALTNPLFLAPGTYYIGVIIDNTTGRLNTHTFGNFGQAAITGAAYATAMATTSLTITPPTTFTTAVGPIAALY